MERISLRLKRKSFQRKLVRIGLTVGNALILIIILSFVVLSPSSSGSPDNQSDQVDAASVASAPANPLDQLSSASIARTVSQMTDLPEQTAVTNQADSQVLQLAYASSQDDVVDKPQVVATALKSRADIVNYTSVAGDTVSGLAVKFGVTSDSIRWSNPNLPSADAIAVGTRLTIPPVDGIVYTVQAGDSTLTLSQKYNISQAQIVAYNDAELSGLYTGEQIILPGAKPPIVATNIYSGSATYGSNGYDYGYCTWWVAKLRAAAGDPLPTNLGDASTWYEYAQTYKLSTGTLPQVGAAAVWPSYEDHVAYVTGINSDGTVTISEMNRDGWDVTDTRTINANEVTYIY